MKALVRTAPLPSRIGPRRIATRSARLPWLRWSDDEILDLRFCDLGVRIENTWLETAIACLYDELEQKGIRQKPHCWLSNEWFCPDGVGGFAIPFYLAHPRLMKLEQASMREVEGGTFDACLKLMRHETGHALQNAYRLHRKPQWQRVFGNATRPYPPFYQPRPASRSHVLHLDFWYAQSHPVEDFAETFAVWLAAGSRWRSRYSEWPALKKLHYVDELMSELSGQVAPVRTRSFLDPLPQLRQTLREHYRHKRAFYGTIGESSVYDEDLRCMFAHVLDNPGYEAASAFIRRNRAAIREQLKRFTHEYDFALDHVLREMIQRCRRLRLRRVTTEAKARNDFALLLTARTVRYLHTSRDRYAL